jgi:predicted outer membrane repeat protein
VDSTQDHPDKNVGDGKCRTRAGVCTLRAAVMEANYHHRRDKIKLPAGVYALTKQGADNTAERGDLDIRHDLLISGPVTGEAIIDGERIGERVFTIHEGARVNLTRLTIQKGNGGIRNLGALKLNRSLLRNNAATSRGGALFNNGTAAVLSSTLQENTAFQGGGIYTSGTLVVRNSTLDRNRALGASTLLQKANGGGIFSFGDTTLVNTTVTGNAADGSGGGIFSWGFNLRLEHVTLVLNQADADRAQGGTGGGIKIVAGQALVYNSIVANNIRLRSQSPSKVKDDCRAGLLQITFFKSVVEDVAHCPVSPFDNLISQNPRINALDANGGPTLTHSLAANSPAIDLAPGCAGGRDARRDQRNHKRPVDGDGNGTPRCDAGAFEYDANAP